MRYIAQLFIVTFLFVACKKETGESAPITSVAVVNAVNGGLPVKLSNSTTNATIANNSFAQLLLRVGTNSLYVWPEGDSAHPYVNMPITTADREVYSLFVTGTAAAPEGIVVKESIPYRTDSTAGIRFINLAPGSTPLNITRSISPTVNEVSNLAYKDITEFKPYPGLFNSAVTFQIRAASNPNTVLASFSFTASTIPRFANVTLVIRKSGSGVAVFRVNNDR